MPRPWLLAPSSASLWQHHVKVTKSISLSFSFSADTLLSWMDIPALPIHMPKKSSSVTLNVHLLAFRVIPLAFRRSNRHLMRSSCSSPVAANIIKSSLMLTSQPSLRMPPPLSSVKSLPTCSLQNSGVCIYKYPYVCRK